MTCALIDNDVIIKVASYGLGAALIGATTINGVRPGMLGVGRFVVRDRLSRPGRIANRAAAIGCFDAMLPQMSLLEPTEEELAIAAELETAAVMSNLELDGGESQLIGILLARAARILITGDKRAVLAISQIRADAVRGLLACFEQLAATFIQHAGAGVVRSAVCSEPLADKTMTICCNCASGRIPTGEEMLAAMDSYISDLRRNSNNILFAQAHLSALAA